MEKNHLKSPNPINGLFILFLIFAFEYLLMSFVMADINFQNWPFVVRIMLLVLFTLTVYGIYRIFSMEKK